jgi:hypothetical protein
MEEGEAEEVSTSPKSLTPTFASAWAQKKDKYIDRQARPEPPRMPANRAGGGRVRVAGNEVLA